MFLSDIKVACRDALRTRSGHLPVLLIMLLSPFTALADVDFTEAVTTINDTLSNAKILINVIGGLFCLIFIIRIAMAYFGGGEEGRQDAGGMVKKLIIGIIVWIVAYQVVDGIFGTNFSN